VVPGQANSALSIAEVDLSFLNRWQRPVETPADPDDDGEWPKQFCPSDRRFRTRYQIDILYRMQHDIIRSFLLAITLSASSAPLLAHHSFAAEYDDTKPIKVTGVITKVEWQNPHVWFYVDVKSDDGKVTNYAFSGGAPGQLMRRGIMKSALVIGSTITVDGFKAKDGSTNGYGSKVTFPDGRMVFTSNQGAEEKH
jgi:hypothetical protein